MHQNWNIHSKVVLECTQSILFTKISQKWAFIEFHSDNNIFYVHNNDKAAATESHYIIQNFFVVVVDVKNKKNNNLWIKKYWQHK